MQSGHTALQRASAEGHVDIIKQLIKQGASVDHQDEVVSAILISFQHFFFDLFLLIKSYQKQLNYLLLFCICWIFKYLYLSICQSAHLLIRLSSKFAYCCIYMYFRTSNIYLFLSICFFISSYLSFYLFFLYFYIYISICLSISIYIYIRLFLFIFICLYFCLSIYLSLSSC